MRQTRTATGQARVPEAVRDKGTVRRRPPVLNCPAPTRRTGLWPCPRALGKRREHSVISSPLSVTDFSVTPEHLKTFSPTTTYSFDKLKRKLLRDRSSVGD